MTTTTARGDGIIALIHGCLAPTLWVIDGGGERSVRDRTARLQVLPRDWQPAPTDRIIRDRQRRLGS